MFDINSALAQMGYQANPYGGPIALPPSAQARIQGQPQTAQVAFPQQTYPTFPHGNPFPPGTTPGAGAGGCPPGMSPLDWFRLLWHMRGGTGANGMVCAPRPNPDVGMSPDGCADGWIQCKQPIAANALQVGIGLSVQITVRPRREATPRQFYYTGAAQTFTIDEIDIDGTLLSVGAVPADLWNASSNSVDNSVDWPKFSSTTPLLLTVTNISGALADFRSAVVASVNRGGGR